MWGAVVVSSLRAIRRSSVEEMSFTITPRPVLAVGAWIVEWTVVLGDFRWNARGQHVL
jgi:hypothetical protein